MFSTFTVTFMFAKVLETNPATRVIIEHLIFLNLVSQLGNIEHV